jgi:hypothetical protein
MEMFSREDLQQFGVVQFLAGLLIPETWDLTFLSLAMWILRTVEAGHDCVPEPHLTIYDYLDILFTV